MSLVYLALGLVLLYVGVLALTALAQTRLLFPTALVGGSPGRLPASAERLDVRTPDGETLAGIRLGAKSRAAGPAPLLLGFGGNAWNAEIMALYLHDLFPDAEVVAFHYRGYPPSTGRPSAKALLADALTLHDHLRQGDRQPLVTVGFSIGSGVAAYLACRRAVDGLILVTPFDSLKALAREHFPWAPVGLLLRHRMDVVDFVRDRGTPTAVIAAGRDTIVPPRRTEPLRRAIRNLVLDRMVEDAGHNDLYDHPAFVEAMREALARIGSASPAS